MYGLKVKYDSSESAEVNSPPQVSRRERGGATIFSLIKSVNNFDSDGDLDVGR